MIRQDGSCKTVLKKSISNNIWTCSHVLISDLTGKMDLNRKYDDDDDGGSSSTEHGTEYIYSGQLNKENMSL